MSQTAQLLDALKQCLRARGLTYRDVAEALELSEASVKRLFSEQSFSVKRLEQICVLLDMTIYDVSRMSRMVEEAGPRELTEAQEQALADDPVLLTWFYLLTAGWKPARIRTRFDLDRAESDRYLARLEALRLIARPSPNKVRLLTGRRIDWRRGGPIRRLYEEQVKAQFLHSRFEAADEMMRLEAAELSAASVKILRQRIERLAGDVDVYAEADLALPATEKRAYALLLAFRPWTFWFLVEEPPHMVDGQGH